MAMAALRRRTAALGFLGAGLALGLFASPVSAAESTAKPYEIDAILALTGGASFLGTAEQQALQLAEKTINKSGGIKGRPLHINFHDDQTSPQVAVQLTNQALAKKPTVIFGSTLVAMCNAMAPLMASGPVMYCFSPGIHPPAGSYVFTASTSTLDLANALIRYYRLKGWKRIAIMTSTDASGQDAERGLNANLALPENEDMVVVARAHFNTTDVSVSAQIEQIKAANPQAMIAWSTGSPIATIFRGIQQAGLDIPVGTTDGNMTYAQMTRYASFLPKQLYIPAAQWVVGSSENKLKLDPAVAAAQKRFYQVFRSAGIEPDLPTTLGWEPALIIVSALQKLGPNATATQLRDYLGHLKGYAGIDGIYDYGKVPQRGLGLSNVLVTRWNPEKKHWLVVSKATGVPLP